MTKNQIAPKQTPKKELVRLPDGSVELSFSVPWQEVKAARDRVETELLKGVSVPGFRKGMAPKEIAKKSISEETVREELLRQVITEKYRKAVEKHDLKPIITPQIHIEEFKDGEDLKFTAEVAEEPKVELGDYKKAIKDITAKSKIVVPGKNPSTSSGHEEQKPSIDEILTAGISKVKITISKIIIEREVSRLLSQLLDEIKTLGMNLEQYLESKKVSGEQLRDEYRTRAERDIKLEFFLRKVADEEKIVVTAEDITDAISKIEDKAQQEEIKKNPYLVASIIRQQKTIDFLSKI